jgi:hypothetical protein
VVVVAVVGRDAAAWVEVVMVVMVMVTALVAVVMAVMVVQTGARRH